MNREELVEKAADSIRWASERGGWADMASAALAVFEKAHTPTDAQGPTVEEWAAKIRAEQSRAAAKGYTAEHDAEHGIRHLLNWAIDYSRRGKTIASSGLILSALDLFDAMTPESGPSFDPDVLRLVTELRALRAEPEPQTEPSDAALDALYDAFMAHARGSEFNEFGEHVCSECGEAFAWPEGEDRKYVVPYRRNKRHIAREALRAGRLASWLEPSDTQVLAALNATVRFSDETEKDISGWDQERVRTMRAALRAAGVGGVR